MFERVILGLCAAALFVLMVVGAADIVLGKVFGRYLGFKVDMSEVLLAMSVFLAWAIAQKQDAHIRVEIFISRAPRALKVFSNTVTALCGLLVFGLISYGAYNMAARSYRVGETSAATLGFPIWPAKIVCAVAAVLTITILVYQLVRTLWLGARGARDAGQPS